MPNFLLWIARLVPANPIVVRLVQGGSKRLRHLYIRSGYLAIMMLILVFGLLSFGGGGTTMKALAQRGASAFAIISFGQVALLCLLTPVFMAGAIAQESSPRTWDILLTTPLSNLQIVLGTLFGRLFFVLALLLSTLPLFATTQFFGGVPGESIFLSYAIAACSALLVASIAVTLSVTRSAGKRAVFVFYITVVMYLFVTYAADLALRVTGPVGVGTGAYFTTWLTAANPFLALESLLQANTYVVPDVSSDGFGWIARIWIGRPVAAFCWTCVLLSTAMILYSTFRLRIIGTRGATVPLWQRIFARRSGGERPARTVGTNPIAWRERTSRSGSLMGRLGRWLFVAAGAAAALVVIVLFHSGRIGPQNFQLAMVTIVLAEVVIVCLTAINLSGVAVSREREDGTLDLLLTTPIQPGPYLAGKLQGLVQYLLPMILVPFVSMGLAALYVLLGGLGTKSALTTPVSVNTATINVPILFPEGAILVPLVLIAFVAFCVMVGLQWSIKSKGTIGSVIAAFGVIAVVGGIAGLCGSAIGQTVPVIGPVLNALSPVNLALASLAPETVIPGSLQNLPSARSSLAIGALIATGVYVIAVITMHASMKRSFMMTVRRLAGTN